MGVTETVRRSTWLRRTNGRRAMSNEPPYFSIAESGDDSQHRDGRRRRSVAHLAGFDA